MKIAGVETTVFGDVSAENVVIQPSDEHELSGMEEECVKACELSGRSDFCIVPVMTKDWNKDLAPWPAPPVFGKEPFGDGAGEMLKFIEEEVIPAFGGVPGDTAGASSKGTEVMDGDRNSTDARDLHSGRNSFDACDLHDDRNSAAAPDLHSDNNSTSDSNIDGDSNSTGACDRKPCSAMTQGSGRNFFIAGYSLAGLFALWAAYNSDAFMGYVAASPSVWYPGWIEYSKKCEGELLNAGNGSEEKFQKSTGDDLENAGNKSLPPVYLSLGDKEAKTRNKVMARVASCIEEQDEIFNKSGRLHTLEWNEGNHFKDSPGRTAKGIAWMLSTVLNH